MIPDWTFADRMRKIRRDVLDLEQAQFAEKLGVKKQAYAAWETGRTHPRDILALARRVEMLSGVPSAWVLGIDQPVIEGTQSGMVTGTYTPRFPPSSGCDRPALSLVPDLHPENRAVPPVNGSSTPELAFDLAPVVTRCSGEVNDANAA